MSALVKALAAARSAVADLVAAEREAAEQRQGVGAGDPAALDDPRYDAVLAAWSVWMQATNALLDVLGGVR